MIRKQTRIVATLGPASSSEAVLTEMIRAGLDVVRINFSHGKHDEVRERLQTVRNASRSAGRRVGILGDLRGPRIRVGEMTGGAIALETGSLVTLSPVAAPGTPERISVSYELLTHDVDPGAVLLLDDGNLKLQVVEENDAGEVRCRVTQGGRLSSNRGINLPGLRVSIPSLTDKDFADVDFMMQEDFDFVALSFVQEAADVRRLNDYMKARGAPIPVVAKIEKQGALENIDAILKECYGAMVARGDLALEMSIADIPVAQKRIISACRRAAKPVITATQMLESMTTNAKPTRAEATDVANAILDGTDAVMLSGESAIGQYPVEAIRTMAEIAARTEGAWVSGELPRPARLADEWTIPSASAMASWEMAERLQVKAMAVYTDQGGSARWLLSHRPAVPVVVLCGTEQLARRLTLLWGAHTRVAQPGTSAQEAVEHACRELREGGFARPGDYVTVNCGAIYGDLAQGQAIVVRQV